MLRVLEKMLTKRSVPLSDVPLDLVLVILAMPYVMRTLRPSKVLYGWTERFWTWTAAQLRLSSYLFGGRYPAEEVATTWAWLATFTSPWDLQLDEEPETFDGGFHRVPATNIVTITPGVRQVIPVDVHGEPLDDFGRRTIEAQDAAVVAARRDPDKDFMVVYVPPHFRLRMAVFVGSLWAVVSVGIAAASGIPTLIGRAVFALWMDGEVHDGYSCLSGFALLWLCYGFGRALDRMDKYRQRLLELPDLPPASFPVWFVKRTVRSILKVAYMGTCLGVILPTLLGLAVELYVVLPLRLTLSPSMPVRIRLVDMWMLGIFYAKILISARGVREQAHNIHGIIMGIARVSSKLVCIDLCLRSRRSPRTVGTIWTG
jgi:E3 ubiquitin-protein ligase MARCH6